MKKKQYSFSTILLAFIILFVTGCPGVDDQATVDLVDIVITLTSDSLLPEKCNLLLIDENSSLTKVLSAETIGTYTFLDNEIKSYSIYLFSDSNLNNVYDSNVEDESSTYTLLGNITTTNYANNEIELAYTINKYAGKITYHSDFWSDRANRYLLYTASDLADGKIIPVNDDGSYTFYFVRTTDEEVLSVYTFYDANENINADELTDTFCFLTTQSNQNNNLNMNFDMVKAYGTLEYMGSDGRFDFTSTVNPPLLSIEDQSYHQKYYQGVGTDGSFEAYTIKNHTLDIRVNHISSTVNNYSKNYKYYVMFPVRLSGVTNYMNDREVFGIGGTGTTIKIYTIDINIVNHLNIINKNMYILVGQDVTPIQLYTDDSTHVTGVNDSAGTNYTIYFRSFDRTTVTSGIFNDATLDTTTQGYGNFFNIQAFIDTNDDKILTPEDPRSNIFSYGDLDSNNTADWGIDWDDSTSSSSITANMDFTASVLTLSTP